ncbi:MAG: hypothetical protein LLG13_03505 [Bacteroidales bacterium]|nr:hypothetical protein [Bacteroidales bacterium]
MIKESCFTEIKKNENVKSLYTKKGFYIILILLMGFQLNAKGNTIYSNRDMAERGDTIRKTIPYTLPWDDMPIDLSFIYAKEKPAGKHGFLKVDGDKFVFEDGTAARFWGTCFNSAQSFPSHEHSAKVAKRLAKIGVNIVRFHQLDAEWSTPNIFQFTKGENKVNTMSFDPVSIDRLDYLIYCLKQEGTYIHMDLLTYRRFKTGDGVEAADKLGDAAKPYSTYNRRLIELQKKFNYDLWTHINPYTGLAYKDDPAIVLVEVTNECDLFTQKVTLEPYRTELEGMYRKWAEGKKVKIARDKVDFTKSDKTMLEFFVDVTKDYYTEMIQHMRETGVKIPITGTNWSRNGSHLSSQMVTNHTDSHAYWYSWSWKADDKKFQNDQMTGSVNNMLPGLAFNRVADKPFFVSEWDNPWPNEWRAESSLLMASVGAFQGWGGFAIHTYRYSRDENIDMIGKPITSDAIGGVFYRGGVFDTFNDPAKFGLFYHAALLFRRGDIKPAGKTVAIKVDDLSVSPGIKALQLTAEQNRVEMVLPGVTAKGVVVSPDKAVVDVEKGEVLSDTKELYRNLKKKIGWIDTPNTKAIYGLVGKEGEMTLTNLKINVKTDFATVALSTLTNEPIKSSTNMLLTAVGRADNTNSKYNADHTKQLDVGEGPIQVEIIEAAIEITTDKSNLRVMAINPQGFITGYIPSEYKDGIFRFEIGKAYQSMYYLIQSL